MDILAILFLLFGWIFSKKGLVVTALVLSAIMTACETMVLGSAKQEKSKLKMQIALIIDIVLLGLSIIKLCIW